MHPVSFPDLGPHRTFQCSAQDLQCAGSMSAHPNFAAAVACATSFHSPPAGGVASASAGGAASVSQDPAGSDGSPGNMSAAESDSFLFGDNDTIEIWTDECLTANTVLRPRRTAQEYKDAFYAFGQQKYIDYMMRNLAAGQDAAGLPVGQVLRQCVLSSMYFDEQQTLFATQFVAVVCRRIVERALAYGN